MQALGVRPPGWARWVRARRDWMAAGLGTPAWHGAAAELSVPAWLGTPAWQGAAAWQGKACQLAKGILYI
jgi:transcription elongation factor